MSFFHIKLYNLLSIFIIVFVLFISTGLALAENHKSSGYGLNTTADQIDPFKDQVGQQEESFLQSRIGRVIGFVLSFVGVLFLILMIYAGLTWMTAGGNKEQVGKAKSLMINATLGLIIVMGAYALTAFIGQQLTN
jgi:magnesium-transporting ATPase (P-type)